MNSGYRIVLTASRAEMSQYGPEAGDPADGFTAFLCTFPKLFANLFIRKYLIPINNRDGRARFAPYSLRKVEAALADHYGPDKVAICHPDNLKEFVGRQTEVVGITTMDPMGLAYVSMTYNSLFPFGGKTVNSHEFKKLMGKVRSLKETYPFKVAVGGEATWQIGQPGLQAALGIDTLVVGRSDAEIATTMESIIAGSAPSVIKFGRASNTKAGKVPLIRAPAIYGDTEITRGCGRGCAFCSPNLLGKYSVPLEDVMREVEVNIRGGSDTIFTITDDLFLYESKERFAPNRQAIVSLYSAIANYPGVKWIHLSHASLAPVLIDKKLLPELAPILVSKSNRHLQGKRYATVEVGIESGSVDIMREYMKGKVLPFKIDDWPRIVREGIAVFNENNIYPLGTIVVGWPGETENDSIETSKLVDSLHDQGAKMFYTPVLFIPIERTPLERSQRASLKGLSQTQLGVIERCWEYNVELWGGQIPKHWIRIVGIGAKAVGVWRRMTGKKSTTIHEQLGDFLLRTKVPCDPGLCDVKLRS